LCDISSWVSLVPFYSGLIDLYLGFSQKEWKNVEKPTGNPFVMLLGKREPIKTEGNQVVNRGKNITRKSAQVNGLRKTQLRAEKTMLQRLLGFVLSS